MSRKLLFFLLVPPVLAPKNVITGSIDGGAASARKNNAVIAHAQTKFNHAYVCQWRLVKRSVWKSEIVKVVIEKVDAMLKGSCAQKFWIDL